MSPNYAGQFVGRLIDAVGAPKDYPRLGRRVPEAEEREDVRELVFQGCRTIYLVETTQVHILTVIYGSRDLAGKTAKPWDVG